MVANIFKKLGLAGVACIASASIGQAFAADLSPAYKAMPVKAVAPVANWTGLYIGGNVGYGWDSGSTAISGSTNNPGLAPGLAAIFAAGSYPAALSSSAKGVIGGGQIGYNWQMPSQWLIGLEADLQGSAIKGTTSQTQTPAFFDSTATSVTKSIDWFGTVRGRVGFLATPELLLYGTGGLAYGQTKSSFSTTDLTNGCVANATLCANGSSSSVRAGWTAGAGAEAMLGSNWSAKLEYLYVDLGRYSPSVTASTLPAVVFFNTSAQFHEQTVRVGLNYHFNWTGPVVAKY
jgi:outer membrane immunogenic protein